MGTLLQKIAYNTVISSASRIIGTVLSIVIVGLSTRYLSDTGFGQYVTILAYLYFFSVLPDLGLYSIVVRDISKEGANESKIASVALTIRMYAGIISFLLANILVWFLPYDDTIKQNMPLASLGFWTLSNTQVLIGIFQKYLKMELVALADLLGRVMQLVFIFLIIKYDLGFSGIVVAFVAGGSATFLFTLLSARKFTKVRLDHELLSWKKMLKESYPLAVSAILVMIYFKADTIMLSLMKPLEDVGVYGVAYKIMENLIFFPSMFTGLLIPQLAKSYRIDNERFFRITQRSFNFLMLFSLLIISGTLIMSPKIIALIAGKGFEGASLSLDILVFALFFIFLGALFSNLIIVIGKQKSLVKIYAIGAVVNVVANLILIPKYSYIAASFTTVLTEIMVTCAMIYVFYKATNFFPSLDVVAKGILAAILMGGILYNFSYLNVFYLLILSTLLYFGILILIKGISRKELLEIINRKI